MSTESDVCNRYFETGEDVNLILPPIQGYEVQPLVTLDRALERLVHNIEQLDHMIHNVKTKFIPKSKILTEDEELSIKLYTYEWSQSGKSFYNHLNNALRQENRQALKPWFLYLRLFIGALTKLTEETPKILYRAVPETMGHNYKKGEEITWWGFSSCTTSLGVLKDFLNDSESRTIFNIFCKSSYRISEYSAHPKEHECILLPGRVFKVQENYKDKGNLHIIELVEIEPKFPNLYLPPKEKLNLDTNVLLLGPSRVGKTSFINAFLNYLHHDQLADACRTSCKFVIPFSFSMSDSHSFDQSRIACGDADENEVELLGEAKTQSCRSYVFSFDNCRIRFIDTPAIGNNDGPHKDQANIRHIIDYISQYPHLNSICIFLNATQYILNLHDICSIKEILRHLSRSTAQNIMTVITHSAGNFYSVSENFSAFRRILHDSGIRTDFVYMFDNEPLFFIAAQRRGVSFSEGDVESFQRTWNRSQSELLRFFRGILQLKACKIEDTILLNECLEQLEVLANMEIKENQTIRNLCIQIIQLINLISILPQNDNFLQSIESRLEWTRTMTNSHSSVPQEYEGMITQHKAIKNLFRIELKTSDTSKKLKTETKDTIVKQIKISLEEVQELPNYGRIIKDKFANIRLNRSRRASNIEKLAEMPQQIRGSKIFTDIKKLATNGSK